MELKTIDAELLSKMFKQGTYELNKNKDLVDALNVFPVPDGDTGTNMSLTMNSAIEVVAKQSYETVEEVSKAISKGSLMGARGNSGVILSQIFRGFAKGCKGKVSLNSIEFCHAVKDAADTAYSAVLKPVEGTILTVIRKIAEKAMEYTEEEVAIDELLHILIKRGEETLEKTPEYLDVLKQAGVVDAGGKGLLCILNGCYDAFLGKESTFEAIKIESAEAPAPAQNFMSTEDIVFSYCTEFIIQGDHIQGDALRGVIEGLGDSLVFVQDEDLVKVHIHTNNPGIALEEALKYGALKKVKIENMKDQHSNIIDHHQEVQDVAAEETVQEVEEVLPYEEDYGFIAVSMGDGFSSIFSDLGIVGKILGGQTMNPSTEDFLREIEKCPSKHIFLFPNNSNIIMAAEQARVLSKKDVYVIPSKTMAQCITAMLNFNKEEMPETNHMAMTESLKTVKTIQVTYAVRNTTFDNMVIEKDDYLAVADGAIKASGKVQTDVIMEAIEHTVDGSSEIISIYYGADVMEADALALAELIEEQYGDFEVETYRGGQPLYYYVISVE
ncbi:DAK2 domain-containing protein [Fusibacter ferrireducens]|uniref:DAK2 domain-containing protein n=1 Tax=Fusibacter ferrireducens TaxID=2785058 RepID=A0ABR9ZNI0_9FIRM|nr:DAK2 domain-containing protein [Fusibacter ferrireducens]MBF4691683.1 DAK2 domain-containing protein [Fusibacter ferrireducens]